MPDTAKNRIAFADFIFDTGGNLLFRSETVVPLEPMAARVLNYLLENDGRLVSKNELLDAVWSDVFTTEDVLKRAVSRIRRALGDDANNPRFIETHHRRGYRFIVPSKKSSNGNNFTEPDNLPSASLQISDSLKNAETDAPNFDCFVGRGSAMEFMQAEFGRVLRGGKASPILIVGEPGIGKTQTVTRFADWANAEKNALPLRVRFFDYEASYLPPYNLFLDLLGEACAAIFGSADEISDDKTSLRRLIEKNLKISLPNELFMVSSGERRVSADASRTIAPLTECFVRLSRLRPLVLIFDDIQWADETSRQIIGYLMRIAADAPLMIVGLARRGDAENPRQTFGKWLQSQAAYRSFTTLRLAPLSIESCLELIREVFRGQLDTQEISVKDSLKLYSATGGNPYFVVEILRLLINEKVVERSVSENDLRWHWRGIADVPLPETVRMAARAKLVNLSADALQLIECAAVLGDSFQIETLALMSQSINEKLSNEMFEAQIDESIAAQILTEQNVSGTDDCQFYHTTLRRAVYMDLSPRRRKRLHLRAAHAIEQAHSDEIERVVAALASHYENAFDYTESFCLNVEACRAAVRRFDWSEAAELLARAERVESKISGIGQISGEEFLKFQSLRGEIYMSVGRRVEAEKVLSEAASLAEKTANKTDSAIIFLNFGRTRILLGKYREAIPVLEKALDLAKDKKLESAIKIQIASAKYALCEYEESSEILQKIIDEDDEKSYNRAVALGKLGWTRALQSRYTEGKVLLEESLKFHRTAGDMRERAVLAMCLNACEYGLGNYEAAIAYAKQARGEAQIVGEPYNESVAMMRIAKARIAQGLYAEAEKMLEDVWEKQKNLDAPHAQAETIWLRGRNQIYLKNYEQASKDLQTALEMIQTVGDRDDEFRILIDQAYLQIRLGNFADALKLSETAAQIAEEIGIIEGIGEALLAKSEALLANEKFAEAQPAARETVRLLKKFDSGELRKAFYSLASALIKLDPVSAEIEENLRSSLTIIDKMREQSLPGDESSYVLITKSLNAPAKDLHDLLLIADRQTEAEEIRRAWLID